MVDLERHLKQDAAAIQPAPRPQALDAALRRIAARSAFPVRPVLAGIGTATCTAMILVAISLMDKPAARDAHPGTASALPLAQLMERPALPEPEAALQEEWNRVSADITRLQKMVPGWALPAAE